jgi:hypothetical protein
MQYMWVSSTVKNVKQLLFNKIRKALDKIEA